MSQDTAGPFQGRRSDWSPHGARGVSESSRLPRAPPCHLLEGPSQSWVVHLELHPPRAHHSEGRGWQSATAPTGQGREVSAHPRDRTDSQPPLSLDANDVSKETT